MQEARFCRISKQILYILLLLLVSCFLNWWRVRDSNPWMPAWKAGELSRFSNAPWHEAGRMIQEERFYQTTQYADSSASCFLILASCFLFGGPTWDWTRDRPVMSRMLYRWAIGPKRKIISRTMCDKNYYTKNMHVSQQEGSAITLFLSNFEFYSSTVLQENHNFFFCSTVALSHCHAVYPLSHTLIF